MKLRLHLTQLDRDGEKGARDKHFGWKTKHFKMQEDSQIFYQVKILYYFTEKN